MVYPIYRLLSGLATLGLPLALTKWVSEYLAVHDYLKVTAIRRWAVRIVSISAILIGISLIFLGPVLANSIFTDSRVTEALFIIAFAIPFSSLSAIYRGYYQGYSRMAPTATSEIIEQIIEISTVLMIILMLKSWLPFSTYTAPITGLTMGEVACFITLFFFLNKRHSNPHPTSNPLIVEQDIWLPYRNIFRYAWPLLLNQIILSISMASEGIIIPRLLISAGHAAAASTGLFGQLTGMAEPVAYFPLIFLAPLGPVLSPQVSAAFKTNSLKLIRKKIALFYLTATILCLISFLIILSSARFIAQSLYNSPSSAVLIRSLVIGLPFTAIAILNLTILSATGGTDKILWISIWTVGLKTFSLVVLTPLIGIHGSAWAINITQIFQCLASSVEAIRCLQSLTGKVTPDLCRHSAP